MIAVGVDAGGTSTVAAAMHDGALLEPATGPSANPHARGVDHAVDAIAATIARATGGIAPDAIVVGAAGAGVASVAGAIRAGLSIRFPRAHIEVKDDAALALRAAIARGDGMVLVAGTGSIAYAEIGNAAYRAGGFGALLGDEGSGFAIGAAALRATVRALDGRAVRDELADAILARAEASTARELVAATCAHDAPVATIASFAPLVIDAATRGERAAAKIVQAAALELFDLVRAVLRKAPPLDGAELPLAFAGGLLASNSLLTYLVETRIANELPHLAIVKNAAPPYAAAAAAAQVLLENR
ncbi:MAG: hypothetical protein JOY98_00305 [Candidatus Eremiobacteraeota bacterium]|nr:hypothetical protein [Candidatus Eremiobacteraeota bacterium]